MDALAETKSPRKNVRSALRALSIIELFGSGRTQLSIKEVAEDLDLPPSTTVRLMQTLESERFVRKDENGRYLVGPRLLRIAAAINDSSSIIEVVHAHLVSLRDKTGETVCFATLANENEAVYLDQCSSPQSIRYVRWVGQRIPVEGTAIGFVLKGRCSRGEYRIVKSTYEKEVTAVAAPIYARDETIVGGINVTGPAYRLSDEDTQKIAGLLTEEVAFIESEL